MKHTTFENFRMFIILIEGSKLMTFQSNDPSYLERFRSGFWWKKIKVVACVELEFEKRVKFEVSCFLWEFLENQELDRWIKSNGFIIESSSLSVKISFQAVLEEIKQVFAEKKRVWTWRCIIDDSVYRKFRTNRTITQHTKPPILHRVLLLNENGSV